MITPSFKLSQTDETVTVYVRVPYAKVSEAEIYYEDYEFKFYCKPYYLRLNLPGKVLDSEETSNVTYNVDENSFIIPMTKALKGEDFQGLDLLTKLLAPKKGSQQAAPKIEVVGEVENYDNEDDDEESDWEIEQTLPEDEDVSIFTVRKCGFNNMYDCNVFKLKDEASVIFDVNDVEKKSPAICQNERLEQETKDFDEDHYIADLFDDAEIQTFITFEADWDKEYTDNSNSETENQDKEVQLTAEENDRLIQLPNKEYICSKSEVKILQLGLVDILYAFAYNKRTTLGEDTVESAWAINKMSAVLSWLEEYSSLNTVVNTVIRRSLIYPYARSWDLSMKVLKDVVKILSLGQKYVLKCFLEIRKLFDLSEPRYILNDLYITDYCVWIQSKSCSSKIFQKLAESIEKITMHKDDMKLDLLITEYIALFAIKEHKSSAVNNLCSTMSSMNIKDTSNSETRDSDDSSSESESSSDDDSSSESDSSDASSNDERTKCNEVVVISQTHNESSDLIIENSIANNSVEPHNE